ncbi:MAG: tRNA adenosine(34) deaminase TadA [Candidatus Saccharimonadales bacterium]
MQSWINLVHMKLALEQAEVSKAHGEYPFGAVLVHDGKVLVRAENGEHRKADVTAHAEMMAISEACWKLGRRDLSDCTIYSSAEPCPMCSAAIFQSNIPRVVFGLYRDDLPHLFRRRKIRIAQLAEDWDYEPEVVGGILREEAVQAFEGIEKPWRVAGANHGDEHRLGK